MRRYVLALVFSAGLLGAGPLPARGLSQQPLRAGDTPPGEVAARYLAGMHRPIHKLWVEGVLTRALDELGPDDPFNDPTRKVTLRLVLKPTGEIREARVTHSSGHAPFDTVARLMMLGIFDYPLPPLELRSDDGDVHVDWTIHRQSPWCHSLAARVVYARFTHTLLARGELPKATRLLARAVQAGQVSRYSFSFGMGLLRLALERGGAEARPHLGRFVEEPLLPERLLGAALEGADHPLLRLDILRKLARRTDAEAVELITRHCVRELGSDAPGVGALRETLEEAPQAARRCLAAVRRLPAGTPERQAALAAVKLMAGGAEERREAETVLLSLLQQRDSGARLAALEAVGRRSRSAGILARFKSFALGMPPSESVLLGLIGALRRVGTEDAGRVLLMLSYTRKEKISLETLKALAEVDGPALARCYRFLTIIRSVRTSDPVLRAAARGLATRCARGHLPEVRAQSRHPKLAVRQGLAEGLSPGGEPERRLLETLAQSPSRSVRLAALESLHSQDAAPGTLDSDALAASPRLQRLACRRAADSESRRKCFGTASGEPGLALARRYIAAEPELVLPEVLKLLGQGTWESRLKAAWILLGLPETQAPGARSSVTPKTALR